MNERTLNSSEFFQKSFPQGNIAYELKLVKGKSIPFIALEKIRLVRGKEQPTQLENLFKAEQGTVHIRIADSGHKFTSIKLYDGLQIEKIKAYIIICFYEPRKKKNLYFIRPKKWAEMRNNSKRKSASEEMCLKYCEFKRTK